ncbi:class I SAM-dependent methyltransferase [Haloactinomyces albus]|uniref:2-polyprenyl-3-methyl-5-hydroxy-6-metoxy-1, 4-benzoquinol methylase n=1 Tax=Haloactinomyces albus TaxID=1352928 RepID=A0AAE4CQ34_9ACTN|nr:class I SAM-dependent methyltransferase [Haloactinomyces albus]MDR7302263.1 2-polyprenyl-3-methyl-5-hydroxy-6-metoxy-1,4-benzoquinol methylase [Haloactinomyces albus]
MTALTNWAEQLEAWAIPQRVLEQATDSPWVLPRQVFAHRADRRIAEPDGASHREAASVLERPGTVLDIGAGAGASSLPLSGRCPVTEVTAVEEDARLLEGFRERADRLDLPVRTVRGWWPEVAEEVGAADLVVAGNVLYNIADLAPFVSALTDHARRRVVTDMTSHHPLTALNPLWQRFHGITRPSGPTAHDCIAALTEMGIRPEVTHWSRPVEGDHATFADLVEVTRRRLCLPASATAELESALRELDVDPAAPPDLGTAGRDMVTLSWQGTADSRH